MGPGSSRSLTPNRSRERGRSSGKPPLSHDHQWPLCANSGRSGTGPRTGQSTQSGRSRGALRSAGFVPFADLQLIPWTGDLGEELSFPIDFFQIPAGFVRESQAGSTT